VGLDHSGGEADEETAGTIALVFTNWSKSGAVELYEHCVARTERLVASWRFQDLLLQLYEALMAVPAMSGDRAGELLRSWDPQATVSRQWDWTYADLAATYAHPRWVDRRIALEGGR
jgi:hypothetical protein